MKHTDTKYNRDTTLVGRKNTETLARKGTEESHICTVNRTAVPRVNWHWQCVPTCDPGELSQLLAKEPQSLDLSLSLHVFYVAAVVI